MSDIEIGVMIIFRMNGDFESLSSLDSYCNSSLDTVITFSSSELCESIFVVLISFLSTLSPEQSRISSIVLEQAEMDNLKVIYKYRSIPVKGVEQRL